MHLDDLARARFDLGDAWHYAHTRLGDTSFGFGCWETDPEEQAAIDELSVANTEQELDQVVERYAVAVGTLESHDGFAGALRHLRHTLHMADTAARLARIECQVISVAGLLHRAGLPWDTAVSSARQGVAPLHPRDSDLVIEAAERAAERWGRETGMGMGMGVVSWGVLQSDDS